MTAKNKIALLVPCYNASKYIKDFLNHISNFDFGEVIFYDDASTDSTLAELKSSGYPYLSSATNNGPGYARNRLAEIATCDYIHFHDVDDKFDPNFLDIVNTRLPQTPDVIVGNADWLDEQTGKTVIEWRYDPDEGMKDTLTYFIAHPLGVINTVYKKEKFLVAGGFNETIKCWEDSDLHIQLARKNYKFVFTNKVLAYSIRHNNGISNDQGWCWRCRMKFLEQYLATFPEQYKTVILEQVAICAQVFYNAGMKEDFNKSVAVCKKHRMSLPVSKQLPINILKKLDLPPRFIYNLISWYKKLKGFKY